MATNKWALITGASGGIGLELAKLAAADGYDLLLVAHDAAKLSQASIDLAAAGRKIDVLAIDLGAPGAAANVFDWIAKREVAMLINNAGFATHGAVTETELGLLTAEIGVNVTTLTELSQLIGRDMQGRRHGFILNLASTAAFAPGPLMAVYFATKAYVLSFSVAMANELASDGIVVTALCPGPTSTGFAARAALKNASSFGRGQLSAANVARAGYAGLKRGQTIVVPGLSNKIKTWGVRLVPRKLAAKMARGMAK